MVIVFVTIYVCLHITLKKFWHVIIIHTLQQMGDNEIIFFRMLLFRQFLDNYGMSGPIRRPEAASFTRISIHQTTDMVTLS